MGTGDILLRVLPCSGLASHPRGSTNTLSCFMLAVKASLAHVRLYLPTHAVFHCPILKVTPNLQVLTEYLKTTKKQGKNHLSFIQAIAMEVMTAS